MHNLHTPAAGVDFRWTFSTGAQYITLHGCSQPSTPRDGLREDQSAWSSRRPSLHILSRPILCLQCI